MREQAVVDNRDLQEQDYKGECILPNLVVTRTLIFDDIVDSKEIASISCLLEAEDRPTLLRHL